MSGRVLYSSPFVPPEWIAAHGFSPVRAIPACRSAGEGACPIAAGFGELCGSGEEAVILTTTCDQMRRQADVIAADERVFLMNVPATWQSAASRRLYRDELARMGRFLVRRGGRSPGNEELARVMMEYKRPEHVEPEAKRAGTRVALVGGPLRGEDGWIKQSIEENGALVAFDGTETGERARRARFEIEAVRRDPLGELVRAYFDTIPDAFRRPLSMLHEYLLTEFDRRKIEAVVLVRALWCDLWHAQLPWLREVGKRPVIEIDLGGKDQELARTRTRIEALLEVTR